MPVNRTIQKRSNDLKRLTEAVCSLIHSSPDDETVSSESLRKTLAKIFQRLRAVFCMTGVAGGVRDFLTSTSFIAAAEPLSTISVVASDDMVAVSQFKFEFVAAGGVGVGGDVVKVFSFCCSCIKLIAMARKKYLASIHRQLLDLKVYKRFIELLIIASN
ncbi:hypothetical protein FF38_13752 [Lucilia cuprina]|uniref:Uncharacterized protein n=1 Tax=Lucilia cuprina TaxID=7375 RepID=A0A0L0BSH3_LUCCU|nr:hypothetical protein FF38_13752 [Lucilia cuprina]